MIVLGTLDIGVEAECQATRSIELKVNLTVVRHKLITHLGIAELDDDDTVKVVAVEKKRKF